MQKRCARYWNANGVGIAVVAVITEGVDWAAYIGADDGQRQEHCIEWTADMGEKLCFKDATYFFPDIELPYRD